MRHLYLALLCFISWQLSAQTTIATYDFEASPAAPAMTFSPTGGGVATATGPFPAGEPRYVSGTQGYEYINESGTALFSGMNTTGYTNIDFSIRLASFAGTSGNGADGSDYVVVAISTDGGATWSEELQLDGFSNSQWSFSGVDQATVAYDGDNSAVGFSSSGGLDYSTLQITGLPSVSDLQIRLELVNNSGNEIWVIEDALLEGDLAVVCPHTVSAFAPTSGPAGTEVIITGTGFTAATSVSFAGVAAANTTFVDATTLIATVPTAANDGQLTLSESACDISTPYSFTYLEEVGSCAGTPIFTDLIISEVYDNNGGSLGYIEVYNGTASPIDLSDYEIRRYGDLTTTTVSFTFDFPAITINPGQVLVGRASSATGGVEDFIFAGTTSGYNDDDRLELVHVPSGTVVDDFEDQVVGAVGYLYRRNTTVTGPNPNFDASEWTTGTSGDVSDLGTFAAPSGPPLTPPTFSVQPSDVNSCELLMGVTASANNGGTLTYQWYFNENDGVATGWTAVSAAAFPNATTVSGETSDVLLIQGNLVDYDGYQFYCEVIEDGSCGSLTEAAQFNIGAERFYRSATIGYWTDVSSWEMASSAAGPWVAACDYPRFDNSDYVHILNGHLIELDQDIEIDQLVVEAGGELVIPASLQLRIQEDTGIDFLLEGTLEDHGAGGGNGINFQTGASWEMGANATIIKTGSSTVAAYRDNYENGISTIPATAHWHFRYANNGSVSVITNNMYYPNLYMESVSGDYSFTGLSEVFSGSGGFMTVKGDMLVGNTGTGAVEVFNSNTNASPMQILGDLIIGGNPSASVSKLENNDGTTAGTGMEVFGSLLINNNGLLDYDDPNASAIGLFRLHGDWLDDAANNGFDETHAVVEFVGSTDQTVIKTNAGAVENFRFVRLIKPAGFLINNCSDIYIDEEMDFQQGIVLGSASERVYFDVDATAINASDISHVDGPVLKETSGTGIDAFTYPTGDNGIYGAIGIETAVNTGEFFVAQYFNQGYGTYNLNAAELDHVSVLEYWTLDEVFTGTGASLFVTLHWGPHSQVLDPNDLLVGHYFTQAPSTSNQWESEGNTFLTGTATSGSITSNVVTSFSPFTLADVVGQLSLPLELLDFTAQKVEGQALLSATVANEHAGDEYCFERSLDGVNFETIACFTAQEDLAQNTYNTLDEQPAAGYNYYRLRQNDVDGSQSYSDVKVLYFGEASGETKLFPIPANNQIQLELPSNIAGYQAEIIDALGRVLQTQNIAPLRLQQQFDLSNLAAGQYILRLQAPNGLGQSHKFTVEK
ncbi:lamin tail domain-containing protein [Saprospira sp. CCB-QB6]|uniref:lamin tail domain-containing protein n=1 Tax=Saprospira sp. CCB-QB6 TaxID=3023936 RepID=UPI00234A772C|nr:lamin tail domain-containing protein [Saprospira sp. CCB-QB6]WCL81534.1 lamin tail domain-containing protein [Saprospira sp. CCB-QB6]